MADHCVSKETHVEGPVMTPKAILFGAIGTLTETSEIQRDAFNQAFEDAGLGWSWDVDTYLDLLKQPGGQARIERYAKSLGEDVDAEAVHFRKSALFQERLNQGLALREGVMETLAAARQAGVKLGFVTTTSAENVYAILLATQGMLERSHFDFVGHSDMVAKGKPEPDIYDYALAELGLRPNEVIAIEDTPASAQAAVAAGIECVGFRGAYARGDFPRGVKVVHRLEPAQFGLVPELERAAG